MSTPLVNPAAAAAGTGLSPGNRGFDIGSGLAGTAATVATGNPFVGQLVSSGLQFGGNLLSKLFDNRLSKDLYDYQTDYEKLSRQMIAAGITPAAAHQGLSGATPSMQAVSGHAAPDLGNIGSLMLEQERNPSVIARNEAETMLSKARVGEIGQLMQWNPRRWSAEIRSALSQVEVNHANSFYLNGLARTVEAKRPWEISSLEQGLKIGLAQIQNYNAQSALFRSQGQYFDQKTMTEKKITFINKMKAGFWRNGINPDEPPMRSLLRLTLTDPKAAEGILNHELQFLGIIDNKITDQLGKNWKKYAAAGLALHYINNRLGEHASKRSRRNRDRISTIGQMAGIAASLGTGSPVPAALTGSAMDNEDWFDYFSGF